jgi:hypothetical protein
VARSSAVQGWVASGCQLVVSAAVQEVEESIATRFHAIPAAAALIVAGKILVTGVVAQRLSAVWTCAAAFAWAALAAEVEFAWPATRMPPTTQISANRASTTAKDQRTGRTQRRGLRRPGPGWPGACGRGAYWVGPWPGVIQPGGV